MQLMQRQLESFGNYLANIRTDIRLSSYRQLGVEWVHTDKCYEYNLLYYIASGRCNLWVNGRHISPSSGKLVLLPAGTIISAASYNKEPFTKYFCHFSTTVGGTRLFDLLRLGTMIEVEDTLFIEQQFQNLIASFANNELTSALRAKSTLQQILCYFIEKNPAVTLQDSGNLNVQSINRVIEHIQTDLAERLNVDDLAKLVHFHPHYFTEVFKSMIGYSPMQFIAKMRYERACELLSSTRLSIHEIAGNVGIQHEYFTKFFRHHSGISPTAFRESAAEKNAGKRGRP